MEEAWKVSLQDQQMGMNLFELHSYLQFPYEYVEESLMLKSRIIHWKKKKNTFLQAMQNCQMWQPHLLMKLYYSQKIMQTSQDLEPRKASKPETDFVLQQLFCQPESWQRCLVTLPVNWKL